MAYIHLVTHLIVFCTYICMSLFCLLSFVFSSRFGWWKALPVSPATSSKVQKCHCYWVGGGESQYTILILHCFFQLMYVYIYIYIYIFIYRYIIICESLTKKFTVIFVFGVFFQTNSGLWSLFLLELGGS